MKNIYHCLIMLSLKNQWLTLNFAVRVKNHWIRANCLHYHIRTDLYIHLSNTGYLFYIGFVLVWYHRNCYSYRFVGCVTTAAVESTDKTLMYPLM